MSSYPLAEHTGVFEALEQLRQAINTRDYVGLRIWRGVLIKICEKEMEACVLETAIECLFTANSLIGEVDNPIEQIKEIREEIESDFKEFFLYLNKTVDSIVAAKLLKEIETNADLETERRLNIDRKEEE